MAPAAHTWSGAGSNGLWSNAQNWSAGGAPVVGESAVTLSFPSVTNKIAQDNIPGLTINSITFTANGYTISGGSSVVLTLSGAAGDNIFSNVGSGSNTFSTLPLALAGANRLDVAAGGTLAINGIIENASSAGSLIKQTNSGTLVLNGANTYSGGTTLSAGTLRVGCSSVVSGGVIASGPLGTGTLTAGPYTIQDNGTACTIANAVVLTGSGANTIFSSSGVGSLTFDPTGLNTPTTFTLPSGGGLVFDNTTTIKEVITGSGGGAVYPQGSGTLILGAQNTYTAGTYLQGTLTVQLDTDTTVANGTIASGPLGTGVVHFQGSEQLLASGARTLANSVNIQTTSPVTLAGSDGSSSLMLSPAGLSTASAFTLQANASLVVKTPTTVKEAISGGFSLSKSGTSTLTLSAANTYTGTTTVSAGKLLVANSSGSGTGTGAITVASGGTLGGTGTLTGAVTVASGGTLAPGTGATSTGILTTGNVTLASGATFASVLNGTTAGSGYDQLSVPSGKDLTLGGSTLAMTCGPNFNPAVGNAFTLISNAGSAVSGTFSGLAGGATFTQSGAADGQSRAFQISYAGGSASKNVVVSQVPGLTTTTLSTATANPAPYGQPVSLTATINGSVAYGLPPVGEAVTFLDGGVAIGTGLIAANGPNGVATLSAASLSAGTVHTLTAVYGGDVNLVGSKSNALVQTVEQASTVTTIVSSTTPAAFGENVAFTATVTAGSPGAGMPTGVVTFLEGANTLGTAPLSSGMATWAASSLSIGNHAITAAYSGDGNFTGSAAGPFQQIIIPATTTMVSVPAGTATFGDNVTFTAAVVAESVGNLSYQPTGTVTFEDSGVSLGTAGLDGSATATFTTSSLNVPGSPHSITVVYGGDGNCGGSLSGVLLETVGQAGSTTALISTANPVVLGLPVSLTATVAGQIDNLSYQPTGTVTFEDSGSSLGTASINGGQAVLTANTLTAGSQDITAVYGGDANYAGTTSAPLDQSISQDGTTTTVYTAANPTVAGQQATFIAVVSPDDASITATGTVTFDDGGTSLGTAALDGTGTATFTMSSLDVAGSPHLISAVYGGDSNFTGSVADPVQQFIMPATTTTVSVPAGTTTFGDGITLTATVAGQDFPAATPTGMVAFMDSVISFGAVTLTPSPLPGGEGGWVGTAMLTTSTLSASTHSITVIYNGDATFGASTSAPASVTVTQATTTVTAISSLDTSVFGQDVTFAATVSATNPVAGTPTGVVTFEEAGVSLGTAGLNSNGTAIFDTTVLSVSSSPDAISAVYGGDANFSGSTFANLLQTVNQASTGITLSSPAATIGVGQPITFTAVVGASGPGAGTATGVVTFEDGGTSLGTAGLDSTGTATLTTTTLTFGSHTLTALYGGDANFTSSIAAGLVQLINTLTVTSFTPTATGFSATFNYPLDPGTPANPLLQLYADSSNVPADVTLIGAVTGPIHGSLVLDDNNMGITFVQTGQTGIGGENRGRAAQRHLHGYAPQCRQQLPGRRRRPVRRQRHRHARRQFCHHLRGR